MKLEILYKGRNLQMLRFVNFLTQEIKNSTIWMDSYTQVTWKRSWMAFSQTSRNLPSTQYGPLSLFTRLDISIWQGLAIRLFTYLHVLQLNTFIAKDASTPTKWQGFLQKSYFHQQSLPILIYQFLIRYFGKAIVILWKMHFIL